MMKDKNDEDEDDEDVKDLSKCVNGINYQKLEE